MTAPAAAASLSPRILSSRATPEEPGAWRHPRMREGDRPPAERPGGSLRRAFCNRPGRQEIYAAAFSEAAVGTSEIVFSTWLAIW